MKCRYCQQPCVQATQPPTLWSCKVCQADFHYSGIDGIHGIPWSVYIYITINKRDYSVRHGNGTTEVLFYPGYGSPPERLKVFPFVADEITPQNVINKLKTILVFL